MPYTIDVEADLLRVTWSEAITEAALLEVARRIAELDAGHPEARHHLTDISAVTDIPLTTSIMQTFVRDRRSRRYPKPIKSAIVAPDAVHFGFARMVETLLDHPQIVFAIFPSVVAAREWLKTPGLALPAARWEP